MKVAALALAFAGAANAQSLAQALNSSSQLSALAGLISSPLVQLPQNLSNVTLLAPSNAAIGSLSNATLGALSTNATALNNLLSYHILQGNHSNFTNTSFVPTYLQQLVTGGQRVEVIGSGNSTTVLSGLSSNVSTNGSVIRFDGGSIHVINGFLVPPISVSQSAVAYNLTSAVGALTAANLASTVDTTPNLTVFVPNNAAFQRIASVLLNATNATLASVLEYHVVPQVVYSTGITNGSSLTTLQGGNVTAHIVNGTVYINNARVVYPNILTQNGVIHIIDSVLNPMNANSTSFNSSSSVAFSGASSGTAGVFTSGVPTPTSSINTGAVASATSRAAGGSSSSSGIAAAKAAIETGAVAMAALFGAVMNL